MELQVVKESQALDRLKALEASIKNISVGHDVDEQVNYLLDEAMSWKKKAALIAGGVAGAAGLGYLGWKLLGKRRQEKLKRRATEADIMLAKVLDEFFSRNTWETVRDAGTMGVKTLVKKTLSVAGIPFSNALVDSAAKAIQRAVAEEKKEPRRPGAPGPTPDEMLARAMDKVEKRLSKLGVKREPTAGEVTKERQKIASIYNEGASQGIRIDVLARMYGMSERDLTDAFKKNYPKRNYLRDYVDPSFKKIRPGEM
jgi:hypothetical protein